MACALYAIVVAPRTTDSPDWGAMQARGRLVEREQISWKEVSRRACLVEKERTEIRVSDLRVRLRSSEHRGEHQQISQVAKDHNEYANISDTACTSKGAKETKKSLVA